MSRTPFGGLLSYSTGSTEARRAVLLRLLLAGSVALAAAAASTALAWPGVAMVLALTLLPMGGAMVLLIRDRVDLASWLAASTAAAAVCYAAYRQGTPAAANLSLTWLVLPLGAAAVVMKRMHYAIFASLLALGAALAVMPGPGGFDRVDNALFLVLSVGVLGAGLNHVLWGARDEPEELLPDDPTGEFGPPTGETSRETLLLDLIESQRAHQVLATLVRASPASVVVLDSDLKVLLWNPAAETTFGWMSYEVLDKRCPVFTELRQPLGGTEDDITLYTKDGQPRRVLLSSSPLFGTGSVSGWVAVMIDVTERRSLRERLERSRQREALGILARGVAHSFNNALAVIEGSAQELLAQLEGLGPRTEVRHIIEACREAADVSRRLLDFGSASGGESRRTEVTGLITQQAQLLASVLGTEYRVEVRTSPGPAWVDIDPSHLQQILTDLALCSRDAMPKGGLVQVVVRADPIAHEVILEVTDEGSGGVGPEVPSPVFDPRRGHGLGLTVTWGLVTGAGGTVDVESEEGLGTTVRVRLPQATDVVPAATETGAPPRGQGERVLLIDDDPRIRRVVTRQLVRLGYAVDAAADLPEAIAAFRNRAPDLVLADVSMPGASGPVCVSHLRKLGNFAVIYMTGLVDRGSVEEGIPLLQKPFTANTLATELRRTLGAPTTPVSARRRKTGGVQA